MKPAKGKVMNTRDDAIAWLKARGYQAHPFDAFSPGAFSVASLCGSQDDGMILGQMIVICPSGEAWELRGMPPEMNIGPILETMRFDSLEEAVATGATIIGP
jgi:hypothetical protein